MTRATHAECVRLLRPLLPQEAFAPAPSRVTALFVHAAIVLGAWTSFRLVSGWVWPVLAIVAGHSSACIAFRAHELAHGRIVRHREVAYALEALFWSFAFVPATLWRVVHNRIHHVQPNGPDDPDRRCHSGERSAGTTAAAVMLFPNRHLKGNPLCGLIFLGYVHRNLAASLLQPGRWPAGNPGGGYSRLERNRVAREIVLMLALQGVAFALAGSLAAYLWAGPVTLFICSAIVTAYIATNHFPNPLGSGRYPLLATTTIRVPRLCDRLHSFFSFHTEHHLFPGLNPTYYPMVSALLQRHFPADYHRVSMAAAWACLIRMELFVAPGED